MPEETPKKTTPPVTLKDSAGVSFTGETKVKEAAVTTEVAKLVETADTNSETSLSVADVVRKLNETLLDEKERVTSKTRPTKLSREAIEIIKDVTIAAHQIAETQRVLINFQVMTYAQITVNKSSVVARLYAHIPQAANEVMTTLINESGIGASFSTDSFTRPTAN